MWASPGADVGEACLNWERVFCILSIHVTCWHVATTLVRWSTTRCIGVCCNAMYGTAAWRGTAGALGSVRCGVDGVGSARQAFSYASAFNQNIGSWNTARVDSMSSVRALVLLHACGARPKFLSQH